MVWLSLVVLLLSGWIVWKLTLWATAKVRVFTGHWIGVITLLTLLGLIFFPFACALDDQLVYMLKKTDTDINVESGFWVALLFFEQLGTINYRCAQLTQLVEMLKDGEA